jgi:hypothetical protein|tara:strand:- start:933 stop:1079 length:147 start_codon:yes stop_codon:yes gene_type:complete
MDATHIDDILNADELAARDFSCFVEEFGRDECENSTPAELIAEMENFF